MSRHVSYTAKLKSSTFLGLSWAGTALSLAFVLFRVSVRIKAFRKLFWDDYLVVLAWIMILGNAILWETQSPTMYEVYDVTAGRMLPTPAWTSKFTVLERCFLAFNILFFSCLWSVKLSVLLFFRRLGHNVKGHRVWWWCVLVITVASGVVCIGDDQWDCLLRSYEYITTTCSRQTSIDHEKRIFHTNYVLDVTTDLLTISIPVLLLWNVKISLRRKLALMGLFSLTVIVMIFSVVRVYFVTSKTQNLDMTWLFFWSNTEMAVSIIIACLASFRQLYLSQRNHRHINPTMNQSDSLRRSLFSRFFFKEGSSDRATSRHHWPLAPVRGHNKAFSESGNPIVVPLESIHVSHDIEIERVPANDDQSFLMMSFTDVHGPTQPQPVARQYTARNI